jgi:chemotaxis protein methyltransferase CheR
MNGVEISPQEFQEIQLLIHQLCGLVLSDEKQYLVRSRLEPVLRNYGLIRLTDYLARLRRPDSQALRDELVESMTTGETSFFRDGHPFEEFRRRILPELAATIRKRVASGYPSASVRIWSAGCSTGQEPWSIAMLIHDFLTDFGNSDLKPEQFAVLGTDISNRSLDAARIARYPSHLITRGLSSERRNRYFREQSGEWTVCDQLRSMVEFRQLNLHECLTGLGSFDLILCRNVLIYFNTADRQHLCSRFHNLLAPGGLLILGAAESLYGLTTPFMSENLGTTTAYRRK